MESGLNLWVWLVGVVNRRWVWVVGGISGFCCKEIYRFPHNITYPYSTCISSFLQLHPYFFVNLKMFFCSLYMFPAGKGRGHLCIYIYMHPAPRGLKRK